MGDDYIHTLVDPPAYLDAASRPVHCTSKRQRASVRTMVMDNALQGLKHSVVMNEKRWSKIYDLYK